VKHNCSLLLNQIQFSLRDLHNVNNTPSFEEYLVPSQNRNALVVHENGEEAEAVIFLKSELLERFAGASFPEDFKIDLLPDLSIVIEELSHFNTFCQRAFEDRPISALELEVQGEVDKFAVALEWLELRNEEVLQGEIFDCLFGAYKIGDWIPEENRSRYEDAHEIARSFCRSLLHRDLDFNSKRRSFRNFFHKAPSEKLSIKF